MQAIDLNLATRPFRNNTLLWVGFALAVLVLGAVTTHNIRSYREHKTLLSDLRGQLSSISGQVAELDRRETKAQAEIEKFPIETLFIKAEKANDVIRWKAFSWTRLFNVLQDILPHDVQMASINPVFRPDTARRRKKEGTQRGIPVSVEGLSKNLRAFFELERALFADPHFTRVEPESREHDENTGETSFRLRFLYDPFAEPAGPAPADGAEEPAASAPDANPLPGDEPAVKQVADNRVAAEKAAGEGPR